MSTTKNPSGRPDRKPRGPERSERRKAAEAAGMSRHQMHEALAIASLSRDEFEALVESDNPPTISAMAALGARRNRERRAAEVAALDPQEAREAAPVLLTNAQADAAERVAEALRASRFAQVQATASAIEAGRLLAEQRDLAPHGTWLTFLERAGVHERQARRLVQLARSGLKPDTVSDLGGIKEALAFLAWMRSEALDREPEEVAAALVAGRLIRDAEEAEPGIVRRTIEQMLAGGREPAREELFAKVAARVEAGPA